MYGRLVYGHLFLFRDRPSQRLVQEKQTPHHPLLLTLLAKELGVDAASIVDFELNVCDTQPGVIGGE